MKCCSEKKLIFMGDLAHICSVLNILNYQGNGGRTVLLWWSLGSSLRMVSNLWPDWRASKLMQELMQEFMLTQELMQSTRSSVSSGKGNRGLAPWAMDVEKTKRQTSVESLIFCDGREDENDRFQCFYMSLTSVANCFQVVYRDFFYQSFIARC